MLDDQLKRKSKKNRIRGIYLLPNILTSASLMGGFYSVLASIDGNYYAAAVAIFVSGVFDCLDGRVARLTKSTSKFGVEYDSLADLVAFGVAPAILIFTWALKPFGRYGWLAAFLYVACAALRLARFNVQVSTVESKRFTGLPVPAAACLIAGTVLIMHYFEKMHVAQHISVLFFIYMLAYLMVSNVQFYSFKELNLSQRMPFMLLVAAVFMLIVIAAEPEVMLFALSFAYVISGPVLYVVEKRKWVLGKFGNKRPTKIVDDEKQK